MGAAVFNYLIENGIQPIGFCPIGSPNRPERDKTPEDTTPAEDPVVKKIAARLGIHPALVCLKWAVQRGQIPIPFSVKREQIKSNLMATFTDPLTTAEMDELAGVDRNCRLTKGQVFLWKDDQTWEDLWDEDGTIEG
ncbi:MAG: aldo/keto reductase [Verrucomicrobiota bacterium]|nr:aldo/keto reductase [Verrucomicrobiota bacterium]